MKITYTIGTHNEGEAIDSLVTLLTANVNFIENELLIVDDFSTDAYTIDILNKIKEYRLARSSPNIKVIQHALNKNFAEHKNFMTDNATGDYIFNIDADEFPSDFLLSNINGLISSNDTIEMFWLPRINIVDGITEEDIKKYGWQVNDKGWINFPDYQGRIYKRSPEIRWKNSVHEVLNGYKQFAVLPNEEQFCLYHNKTIEKQRLQNEFYSTL